MIEEERAIEKLSAIERGIDKMLEMRQQIVELRETENQRQKALEELRASEKKYKTLVENIPHRLFMKDRNSVYVFVNEIYAADLKINPQEISGKTDYDLFPKELAEKYISDEKRIMAKGQLENIEEEYVHEGQTGFVHTVKAPVRDENGDTIGILGIFEDITGRKRDEGEWQKTRAHLEELVSNRTAELETVNQELQREVGERRRVEERLQELEGMYQRTKESLRTVREQYQALLENAKETILVLQEGRLKFGNPQVFAISGYTEEELTARPFQEFIHPDDRERFEFHLKKLGQEKFCQVRPFRLIHKDGIIRWVESRGALIQWEGKPAALNFMTDVTDRKQAGEELRNSIETFRTLVNAMEKYFLL